MKNATALRVYRAVGIWDLLLTLPFALPSVNVYVIGILGDLNAWVSPGRPFPEFLGIHLFFVQLFGILAVLWAIVRIHQPGRFLAGYDTIGRIIVACAMIGFTIVGGSFVPLLFSASEIGFGILQTVFWLGTGKRQK